MDKIRTAFMTFFPIKPDTMGSSAVVNSRYDSWPYKKKAFQISHVKRIDNPNIETIFIKKEKPFNKILKLPEIIFRTLRFLKKSKKKILVIEGASWIFYSFFIIFFFKIFVSKTKIIYISHSIETEIRKKYSNKFIFFLTKLFEKFVFKYSDIVTSVSIREKRKIKFLFDVKTILLPNGININPTKRKKILDNNYIIYTGSYSYKPNKTAIDILNKSIMPALTKKIPKLKLVLTGGGFEKRYPWLINKGIVSKSQLHNLLFFSKCLCVPLKFGSGTRIKIIEALSLGTVVISTKIGIEGIKLNSINPPFIINRDSKIVKKIYQIIKENKKFKKKAVAFKNFYLEQYSMKSILKKFIYENKI